MNECLIHTNRMIGIKRKKHVSRFTDHLRSLFLAGRQIILVNFVLTLWFIVANCRPFLPKITVAMVTASFDGANGGLWEREAAQGWMMNWGMWESEQKAVLCLHGASE